MNLCTFNSGRKGEACLNGCGRVLRMDYPSAPAARCYSGTPYLIDRLDSGYLWGCRACDFTYLADNDDPIEHTCGTNTIVRLGDKVAAALGSLGITKERWVEAKQVLHLPPTCNCDARQAWLNQLDQRLGIGENMNKFKSLLGWK